jgi:hypothetical protein
LLRHLDRDAVAEIDRRIEHDALAAIQALADLRLGAEIAGDCDFFSLTLLSGPSAATCSPCALNTSASSGTTIPGRSRGISIDTVTSRPARSLWSAFSMSTSAVRDRDALLSDTELRATLPSDARPCPGQAGMTNGSAATPLWRRREDLC